MLSFSKPCFCAFFSTRVICSDTILLLNVAKQRLAGWDAGGGIFALSQRVGPNDPFKSGDSMILWERREGQIFMPLK